MAKKKTKKKKKVKAKPKKKAKAKKKKVKAIPVETELEQFGDDEGKEEFADFEEDQEPVEENYLGDFDEMHDNDDIY